MYFCETPIQTTKGNNSGTGNVKGVRVRAGALYIAKL